MLEEINALAATEAIAFQYDQKFPKRLTYLFQTMIDWVDEYNDKFGKSTSTKEHSVKIGKFGAYTEKTIVPELLKSVAEYTGLTNVKIELVHPDSFGKSVFFAMQCTDDDLAKNVGRVNNTFDQTTVKRGPKLDKLIMMAESIDSKGVVKELGNAIPFTIFLPIGAFVIHEMYPTNIRLTAQEIVSIMLHEVGHAMTYLEYAGNMQFSGYFGNSILETISTDMKEYPKETYASVKKSVKSIKTSSMYKTSKTVAKQIDSMEMVVDKYFEESDGRTFNPFKVLVVNLIAMSLCLYSWVTVTGQTMVSMLGTMVITDIAGSISSSLDSKSRSASTFERRSSMFERLADEYVSRFGMSRHLNIGLGKITDVQLKMTSSGIAAPMLNETLRSSKLFQASLSFMTLPMYASLAIMQAGAPGMAYESFPKRLERNIQNLKAALKDKSVPKSFRDSVLDDITGMEADLKKYKRKLLPMVAILVNGVSRVLSKIATSPLTMIIGNINSNYSKFFETLDSMFTNDFYRKAAELERALDE